ncbi:MAG TPA: MATE family efflux transporter, partial [Petrotogaceae bacterium]|nr:MATE family efflux transporter [Petrotogaceae bacterium]
GADMIKKAEDTVKKASILTFTVVLVFSVLLFFTGDTITRFFINDSEVIAIGKTIFMLVSFSNPFFSVMLIYMGAISGSGHTIQSTFIDVARLWAVRVPLIAFMANAYGINGIFYAMIISNIMALIISLLFYYLGNWRQKVIN